MFKKWGVFWIHTIVFLFFTKYDIYRYIISNIYCIWSVLFIYYIYTVCKIVDLYIYIYSIYISNLFWISIYILSIFYCVLYFIVSILYILYSFGLYYIYFMYDIFYVKYIQYSPLYSHIWQVIFNIYIHSLFDK